MPRRRNVVSSFVFLLLMSFLLYALSFSPVGQALTGWTELLARPLQRGIVSVYASGKGQPSTLQKLQEQNADLQSQLAKYQQQDKEIQALRDQFATTTVSAPSLLPTKIIGLRAFIPGISLPEQIILDKGSKEGVKTNDAVIYKNNLLGKVSVANDHISLVDLVFRKGFSVTVTTAKTNALGISKGQGQNTILLDNVVLSDTLQKDDLVTTKGSTESDESGIPPELVVGKIASIDKKASSLFQTAKVQSQLDITRLTTVFVVLKSR